MLHGAIFSATYIALALSTLGNQFTWEVAFTEFYRGKSRVTLSYSQFQLEDDLLARLQFAKWIVLRCPLRCSLSEYRQVVTMVCAPFNYALVGVLRGLKNSKASFILHWLGTAWRKNFATFITHCYTKSRRQLRQRWWTRRGLTFM